MEVEEKPKSSNVKQEIFHSAGLSINVEASMKEEPVVNTTNGNGNVHVDYLDSFPPGYRFCPLDEELITCYLQKKVMGLHLPPNRIMEINLYKYNPERLAELHKQYGEKEWYFFTPRDKKYRNGTRPNRSAGDGYWKATGADREVRSMEGVVGFRKALVFYKGKPPKGDKTSWIMHEYRVNDPPSPTKENGSDDMRLDNVVLCRIYKKADKSERTLPKNGDSPPVLLDRNPNEIIAPDDIIDYSNFFDTMGSFMNQILPEEYAFNEPFPSSYFSTRYMYDKLGQDDLWNGGDNFVDYPSQLEPETEEEEDAEEEEEVECRKEYKRKYYAFKKE